MTDFWFLLFLGFYGHFCAEKRFFGLFLAIFVPKNPKNAKIKNLPHKSLELLIYYVWCDFWPKKMIFGRLDTILVIFQKSRFKSQFSIETFRNFHSLLDNEKIFLQAVKSFWFLWRSTLKYFKTEKSPKKYLDPPPIALTLF